MKNRKIFVTNCLFVISALLLFISGCGKKSPPGEKITPFEKSSFEHVSAQLNPGGSFFLYAGTEQVIRWLDDLFIFILSPEGIATMGTEPQNAVNGIKWFRKLLVDSGIMSIDGVGMSSVSISATLHHSTIVIHRGKRSPDDLISQWTKKTSKPLNNLKLLPTDTVFASFSDHNLLKVWGWIDKEISESNMDEMISGWKLMKTGLDAGGIDPVKLLDSLNGQIGIIVTLDESKTFEVPEADQTMTLPVPGLALIIDTRDDFLFSLLQKTMPMAVIKEENGQKTLTMPNLPLPFEASLQFRQTDTRLIIASNSSLMDTVSTGAASGQGLIDSAEFKELARHMPSQGNGFRYLSPRLWSTVTQTIKQKMEQEKANPSFDAGIGFLTRLLPQTLSLYSVACHQGDSIQIKMNHSFSAGHMMLLPAVSGLGIISAMAIPMMMEAKGKAQQLNQEVMEQTAEKEGAPL